MANVKFSQFTTETDKANVTELVGFKTVGATNTNVGISPADLETNLGNTNLVADANRTYDQDGNDLEFDPSGGIFTINDSSGPPTVPELQIGQGTVDLKGIVRIHSLTYPATDGSAGQVITTDGNNTLSFADVSGVTVATQVQNRLITCTSTNNALEGEAGLLFDGSTLELKGALETFSISIDPSTATIVLGKYGKGSEVIYLGTATNDVTTGGIYAYGAAGWEDSNATSVSAASTGLMGYATNISSSLGMVTKGIIYYALGTGSNGDVVYLDTSANTLTTTPVSGTAGFVSRVMGYRLSATTVYFNPSQDWIEIS